MVRLFDAIDFLLSGFNLLSEGYSTETIFVILVVSLALQIAKWKKTR